MTALLFSPGALRDAIAERTRAACAAGALAPIETEERVVEQDGMRFSLRRASTLAAKPIAALDATRDPEARRHNPFLPPDPALVVAELTGTHLAVLNKFPVIAHHLLVVTRDYVPQTASLDRNDVLAMLACLREYPALAFYNGGEAAGASQPHKHLQLVPLPLLPGVALPFERTHTRPLRDGTSRVPGFAFAHAVVTLPVAWQQDLDTAAEDVLAVCRRALDAAGVGAGPYNLLCTADCALAVARAQERFRGVSVNALGFAGSLFAKDARELAVLSAARPLDVLAAVSRPAAGRLAQPEPTH